MEAPIENAFKVFEAIYSFAAEYELYTELELELIKHDGRSRTPKFNF